ncbi:MAG: DUF1659 domain-containing protein [Clostridiaceae bacterium]
MANSTVVKTSIALRYVDGQDEKGKDILKKQSFNKVNIAATADQLYNVANAMATLLVAGSADIFKEEESVVTNA